MVKKNLALKRCFNQYLNDIVESHLKSLGHDIKVTVIDYGYDIDEEIQKWLWADTVIYQMPGWWMDPPWIVKKYIDEVFTTGHGVMYANDGRSRYDVSKKYGSGGLLQGKTYMTIANMECSIGGFCGERSAF